MTHATRRRRFRSRSAVIGLATIALIVGACGSAASNASPSSGASVAPATPSATTTSTPSTSASSTSSPPRPTPAASAIACAVPPQGGQLPSDKFVDLKVSSSSTADRLVFVFGNPSPPGPAGPPQGSLDAGAPPYSFAGSGAPIALAGEHVVRIRFSGMSLSNDAGQATYVGPPEIRPNLPALRHAVLYDASEGIVGWYLGYDGTGCVTLDRTGTDVTVTIAHS